MLYRSFGENQSSFYSVIVYFFQASSFQNSKDDFNETRVEEEEFRLSITTHFLEPSYLISL